MTIYHNIYLSAVLYKFSIPKQLLESNFGVE